MRLTSGASDGTRNYIVDGIRYVCANFKERAPGTHSERKAQSFLAGELEQGGARLQLGSDYLEGLDQDIIFRTPGLRPDVPQLA